MLEIEQENGETGRPIPLRPPAFLSPGFSALLLLATGLTAIYFLSMLPRILATGEGDWDNQLVALSFLSPLVVPVLLVALRLGMRPSSLPPIEFASQHMELPASAESGRTVRVFYRDIQAIDVRGYGPYALIFIGTTQRLIMYPRSAFQDPGDLERLLQTIHLRILKLPESKAIMERMARMQELTLTVLANRPLATNIIVLLMVVYFAIEITSIIAPALDSAVGLIQLGGNAATLVREGEASRLVTGLLLHYNTPHFCFNALGLVFLGSILERLVGTARFVLIFLVAGIGGAVTSSVLGGTLVSVGMSPAVFGLGSSLALLNWRCRSDLPVGFRQGWRWWAFIAGLGVALPLLTPTVEIWPHLVGGLMGVVVSLLVVDLGQDWQPGRAARGSLRATAAVVSALGAFGLARSCERAVGWSLDDAVRVTQMCIEFPHADPASLNQAAWFLAIDKRATRSDLRLARTAAERASGSAAEQMGFVDTLATVHYRLGDYRRAVDLEREALRQAQYRRSFYAAQLARFLVAYEREEGAWHQGALDVDQVRLSLVPESEEDKASPQLLVELPASMNQGAEIYGLVRIGKRPVGLLWLSLGQGAERLHRLVPDPAVALGWPREASVSVALLDASCKDCDAGEVRLRVWGSHAQVDELP